jgi:hypothetical protein
LSFSLSLPVHPCLLRRLSDADLKESDAMKRFRATFGETDCEVHIEERADARGVLNSVGQMFRWERVLALWSPIGTEFATGSDSMTCDRARLVFSSRFGPMREPGFLEVSPQPEPLAQYR